MSVRNLAVSRVAGAAMVVALLAACADGADTVDTAATGTAASSEQTTDLADITNYELRMEQVDKYFAAFRNIAAAMQRMTPEQREQLDMDAGQTDLNGYVARLESQPEVNRAIRDAGLSAREFSLILWSMLQSGMASAALQSRPELNEDSLAREMQVTWPTSASFGRTKPPCARSSRRSRRRCGRWGWRRIRCRIANRESGIVASVPIPDSRFPIRDSYHPAVSTYARLKSSTCGRIASSSRGA